MRWRSRRGSVNVEDRRGIGPLGAGTGIGLGGILLVLLISFVTGTNPLALLQVVETVQDVSPPGRSSPSSPPQDELGRFAAVVLADTEQTWHGLLARSGRHYAEPRLVLFSGATRSGCGFGSAATGPFYCPMDERIYLDLSFFHELADRFGAPGDFAQAYVIAHEVGHHVQHLLGIEEEVRKTQGRLPEASRNALSVRLELQADCLAGVWGHHAHSDRNLIEPGDFEEGLRAAAAIGDDRLQHRAQGHVQPESWTHGSSEQRRTWLRRGLETGSVQACDTFGPGGEF